MDKVGEAFVSGLITVLLERFLSTETYNLVVGKKLGPELVRRLKTALLAAEALVADAEHKQFGNEFVRKWLHDLRDAVYKAEDLLEHLCIKAATQKPVRSSLLAFFNFEERQMVNEIEVVIRTIEDLETCKESLGLEKIPTGSSSWRTPSSSLVRGNVHGREDDKKALIKMLNHNNEHHLSVIAIVGIGGVGKTTLAQWLYNNGEEEFMKGFDLKAWICVSEKFDIVETTRVVKDKLRSTCILNDFDSLQCALKEELSTKKFFIVLDDVWSPDADKWSKFMTPFQQNGKKGSIVLLTTREKNVASAVQNCRPYFLTGLSENYCWSVFADNASFPQSNGNPELKEIGRKIVKKCDGLPLAAETLGRLLCTTHDVTEWNKILNSDIWRFPLEKSKIIPALLISYFHLPACLKRCFVYCSLYPKDYEFEKGELILLWMAEDLLPPPNGTQTLEEVGCECFDELTSRLCFTEIEDYDGNYYFKMHDLLHDLAIFLAGDFYCNLEKLGKKEERRIQTRHLRVNVRDCSSKLDDSIPKVESLRTLLLLGDSSSPNCNIEAATCDILPKCKYLRTLSFDTLDVLPNSIGELIHLRYLDLSESEIKTLPESLCTLSCLQTLKLHLCSELTMLPSGLHNLVSLRHLDIRGTSLEEMPGEMSKLKSLYFLSDFVVGKHKDNGIQELGGLVNLHGSLEITKLENIVDVKEAKGAKMMDKKHLDGLRLEWCSGDDMVSSTQTERDMLDNLQPHSGLKELRIKGYKGTIFPEWLGHCSYYNMTRVALESCKNCCMLPSLGQLPSLKSLSIEGFHQLKSIGMEFYKNEGDQHSLHIAPFPSLETLEFDDMPSWEMWHVSESETFPRLKKLRIRRCGMLTGEMLNQIFLRIVSSLADVSQVRKLHIQEGNGNAEMLVEGDRLTISGCDSVKESAFTAMSINLLSCLQQIEISFYLSDVSFPGNFLPNSLQILKILGCKKLEFPQQQQQWYNLAQLTIENSCDSLTWLSLDAFPNLKTLLIFGCSNLESVLISEPHHTALQSLTICDCPEFVSLSSDLSCLLPNLESLGIAGCPNIDRLPEGGLPSTLKELGVGGCYEQVRGLSSMANLDTLTHLTIDGRKSRIKSYPEVGSLPHLPSLTTLVIWQFYHLETLECNELLRLTSLQQLHIHRCINLENMAGEKLPSSLLTLKISQCGLLGEQCKKKHQQIWPKIEHIPNILVDHLKIVGTEILEQLGEYATAFLSVTTSN